MSQLNKNWIYLIIVGVAFLVVVSAWEFIQVQTGNRDTFNLAVVEMPRSSIFPEEMKTHLTTSLESSIIPNEEIE